MTRGVILAIVGALVVPSTGHTIRANTSLPEGFTDSIVLAGLDTPTVVAFAPDGRVFVGEKSGIVKVFDSLTDPSPSVFADLRTEVHNYLDRGLLGLAVDPQFPARPYIYVLYTRDAPIGGTAPRWGVAGATSDGCPDPPGTTHGCLASGRLSRLEARGNTWTGTEQVLVDDWFQQFDSHSIGAIAFGPDGALYASGGDAASWQFVDYGQRGIPTNPNGDPPVGIGGTQTPPTAEGGALRSQDLWTEGDPVGLNGTVIRIDPDTGQAMPDNPLISHPDSNARRIVAYGLRNPFRITVRPGTRELWVGDVGWRLFEELNIVPDPSADVVRNFGWPCYDGTRRQEGYDAANLNICEQLYAQPGAVTFGHFEYEENYPVVPGEPCRNADQSMSGVAFYAGGAYPDEYDGSLFFADYTRGCIWVMPADGSGTPDPARVAVFAGDAQFPVDLKTGPGGDLYYVDIVGGDIRRISYTAGNQAPVAHIEASSQSGPAPLTVALNGEHSTDPDGGALTYAWDLNGDGAYDDSTSPAPTYTYISDGSYIVRLRVTDANGLEGLAALSIEVGNSAPTAIIEAPGEALQWQTGESYSFSGRGTDPEDGAMPASALHWALLLNHCSSAMSCHEHPIQEFAGVDSGSFTAPDHEYPSFLTLRLTATDAGGLRHTTVRRLDPLAVLVTLDSRPSGLLIALGGESVRTPATRTVIVGSTQSVSAPSPQLLGGRSYEFASWSDSGGQSHLFRAEPSPTTVIATFEASGAALPPRWQSSDVGAVGLAGFVSGDSENLTVGGAGADVWGAVDGFHYAYQELTGDGSITAHVSTAVGTQAWTKVGVMIRGSLAADAAHAFMLISTGKGSAFQRRLHASGNSTHTAGPFVTAPYWVRLERAGSVIVASVSADGSDWVEVGRDTFAMEGTVLAGLAVSSHDSSQLPTATFERVTLAPIDAPPFPPIDPPSASLPTGWQSTDIGAVGVSGSASEANGTFSVQGAGADVWGSADALHYAYRELPGDGSITARVASANGLQAWTKVGVMIRGSAQPSAAQAFMLISNVKGTRFQWRRSPGETTSSTTGPFASTPQWVRLTRRGPVIAAFTSGDGAQWEEVGQDTFAIEGAVLIGLAVSSHDASQTASATFDNVMVGSDDSHVPSPVDPPTETLPSGWNSTDIGAVGVTGSASVENGTFTIRGAGADVWGAVDAFRFTHREMNGDGSITARIESIEGSHAWTKVGVMMRATLEADSAHAFMLLSTGRGAAFQRRLQQGGTSTHTAGPLVTPGYWVRLQRSGTEITAALSADGVSWTIVGSDHIAMGETIHVGLAVTSHDASQLASGRVVSVIVQ